MKIELGGGNRNRGDHWINVDTCDTADIKHDLDVLPLPFDDDSIDAVYSSHCFEHLTDPTATLIDLARVCKIGSLIEIKVPYYAAEMAMCTGHHCTFSLQQIRNITVHFPGDFWHGEKRLNLFSHSLEPSEGLEIAKHELPFLAGLDDQIIMRWIQGTCHEIRYYFDVIKNEYKK